MRLNTLYNRIFRRQRASTMEDHRQELTAPRQSMTLEAMTRAAQTKSIKPGMRSR